MEQIKFYRSRRTQDGDKMSAIWAYIFTGYLGCSYADEDHYKYCVCYERKAIPAVYVTIQQEEEKVLI